MASFPPSMQRLIAAFAKLPSIGEKSAQRLAYHLVSRQREHATQLAEALLEAVRTLDLCKRCFFLSEGELCAICASPNRDQNLICVVEKPMDVIAIERVGEYRGLYHVLHGLWAPLRGQGPDSMRVKELVERVKEQKPQEVIVATAATVEGDATAVYIARLLGDLGVRSTRPAQGMPKGGELEYADDLTLSRAFSGRNAISG